MINYNPFYDILWERTRGEITKSVRSPVHAEVYAKVSDIAWDQIYYSLRMNVSAQIHFEIGWDVFERCKGIQKEL